MAENIASTFVVFLRAAGHQIEENQQDGPHIKPMCGDRIVVFQEQPDMSGWKSWSVLPGTYWHLWSATDRLLPARPFMIFPWLPQDSYAVLYTDDLLKETSGD